ncbi:MAG: NYN domain-containing protein [Candidatus Thiodiazotropha sp. LLP2]
MRTIIYVDGFNLYYSALSKSPYKWLDIHELFSHRVIKTVEPSSDIVRIKYFTAPILGRFANDPDSPNRQDKYHNALKAMHPDLIEVICGYHSPRVCNAIHADPANGSDRIKVSLVEEKQTDVNISLQMYRDAVRGVVDHQVLVSNDSDLAPALEVIRADCEDVKIGLILPTLSHKGGQRKSGQLKNLAHWARDNLRVDELVACQLPEKIQNRRNKTIKKPDVW